MRRLLVIFIGLILLFSMGCSEKITNDEKTAENYVISKGYNVTARKGEVNKYILEKSKLYGGTKTIPYQQAWSVQNVEPDKYFGKEITVYGFTVGNHPLEKIYKDSEGANVYIMLSEGNVIGGYSYPNADVDGAYYSLDGRTLEEVKGVSFQQWCKDWKIKYDN